MNYIKFLLEYNFYIKSMKKVLNTSEIASNMDEIASIINTVNDCFYNQRYIFIYIDILEDLVQNEIKHEKMLFNYKRSENLKNNWLNIYDSILHREQKGVSEMVYKYCLLKAKSKIKLELK